MRRSVLFLTCVALLGMVGFSPSAEAGTKTLSGTVLGADGRALDVLLGFDIVDAQNRKIDANGCLVTTCVKPAAYGVILRLNPQLGATGDADGVRFAFPWVRKVRWQTTWKVTLPANAAAVFIEAYPKARGTHGPTDDRRYAHAYRRHVAVPYGKAVNVRLPLVCGAGGATGDIHGFSTVNGVRTQLKRVATWSQAPDDNRPSPMLGFNVGAADTNGYFMLPRLQSGQPYQVIATAPDGRVKRMYGIAVNACKATYLPVAF
jgi:hypothetical protein